MIVQSGGQHGRHPTSTRDAHFALAQRAAALDIQLAPDRRPYPVWKLMPSAVGTTRICGIAADPSSPGVGAAGVSCE
ncbi:hypothetical protein A0H81_12167 [Grifola frondosa]|uniref:Uncharacterized protein n=1 Tax=Grifola frondosa TaxID=5627 RepID=A0A1C7LTR3_GRIFR|nr:hypothetical protein A0H81_12167 [Grifola frondosa]